MITRWIFFLSMITIQVISGLTFVVVGSSLYQTHLSETFEARKTSRTPAVVASQETATQTDRLSSRRQRTHVGNVVHHSEWVLSSSRKCRVPLRLARALVTRESTWNHLAVSASGAIGLTQVMPFNIHPLLDGFDPQTNLNIGLCLLRRHYDRTGSWRLALHAYHGGQYRTRTGPKTRNYADWILSEAD